MAGVKITGDKKLIAKLQQLGKKAVAINRRAVNLATTPIVRAAKDACPVDKGDLKRSLTKKVYNKGMTADGIVGADADYVGDDGAKPAHYDHLVEYGHVTAEGTQVPANPFLRTAWEYSIDNARERYGQALADGIDKAVS